MRCNICPLYSSWSHKHYEGETCAIFGDAWDSEFQYVDKNDNVIGCYIEKAYINKVSRDFDDYYKEMGTGATEMLKETEGKKCLY